MMIEPEERNKNAYSRRVHVSQLAFFFIFLYFDSKYIFDSCAVSRGVASWTCDPVLALGQRRGFIPIPGVCSAAIPLGKGLFVHYVVFSDGT